MKNATREALQITDSELYRDSALRHIVRCRLKTVKARFKARTGQTGIQMQENLGWGKGIWLGMFYSDEVKIRFTVGRIETLTRYMGGDVEEMLERPALIPVPPIEPLLKEQRTAEFRFASNDDSASSDLPPADIALHQAPGVEGLAERCPFNVAMLAEQMIEQEVAELVSIHADDMSMMNLTTLIADLTGVLCKRATQREMTLDVPEWQ